MPQYKLFHWRINRENYLQYGRVHIWCFCHPASFVPYSDFTGGWGKPQPSSTPSAMCSDEADNILAPGVEHDHDTVIGQDWKND